MPPLAALTEAAHAVLRPFGEARSLPPSAYKDPTVFEHEQTHIFDCHWLCVGREEDVSRPGQWLRAPVTPEGVLIVRGTDLGLRAFYNVCRHRGSTLLDGPCGRAMSLRCPYHGWTYELSGALCDAPHAPKDLDRAEHALSSVRVGVWQGFVFVALGEGAPSLKDVTHKAPSWLTESDLSHARRVHQSEYTVTANWKLLVENFQESDHFARIHPALERLTPNAAARSVLGEGPWLGGTMTFADGVETVSQSGRRLGRAFVASPQYRRQVSDALLFPALLTSLQPDYLLTYRLYPLSPERTTVVAETFFHPASHPAEGDPADIDDVVSFWNGVNEEDRSICERQQIGVQSRGYRSSRYSLVEDGVHAFDSLVARAYLS